MEGGGDRWVSDNMAHLRQSTTQTESSSDTASTQSYMLMHFPAFPAASLNFLPPKLAFVLDNFMSHMSYVFQCCLNRWSAYTYAGGTSLMTACPFCYDHLGSLCPCDTLLV